MAVPAGTQVLAVEHPSTSFGGIQALRDVSLAIEPGVRLHVRPADRSVSLSGPRAGERHAAGLRRVPAPAGRAALPGLGAV